MQIKDVVEKIESSQYAIVDYIGKLVVIKTNSQTYVGTLVGLNYANQDEDVDSVRFYLSHLESPVEIRIDPVTDENTSIHIA